MQTYMEWDRLTKQKLQKWKSTKDACKTLKYNKTYEDSVVQITMFFKREPAADRNL